MIDLDSYCVRCGTDSNTVGPPHREVWCDVCWKPRKPIPRPLREHIDKQARELNQLHSLLTGPPGEIRAVCRYGNGIWEPLPDD